MFLYRTVKIATMFQLKHLKCYTCYETSDRLDTVSLENKLGPKHMKKYKKIHFKLQSPIMHTYSYYIWTCIVLLKTLLKNKPTKRNTEG